MKNLLKILGFARPYKGYVFLNILFNLLAVIFSLFSITRLIPFLDLIFLKKGSEYAAYYEGGAQAIAFSTESLIGNFNYHLSAFIIEAKNIQEGKFEALVFLCIIIGILFFFKKLFGSLFNG